MPLYAAFDVDTGRILRITSSPVVIGPGEDTIEVSTDLIGADSSHYVRAGKLAAYPAKPGSWAKFDYKKRLWMDPRSPTDLAKESVDLKRAFQDKVNAKRAKVIAAGTDVNVTGHGSVALQGRPEDQTSLQGLAFGAQLRLSMGDNTTLMVFLDRANVLHQLTPMQMIELWQKGAAFVSAIYARSWAIKEMDPAIADVSDPSLWAVA